MMICEFCKRPIGWFNRTLNSIRGVPKEFCRDSHYVSQQQKQQSGKVIKEIRELLGNPINKLAMPVVSLKLPKKRKCPHCLKLFLSKRVNQKCCGRSCARRYFYSLNQIKYICTKKLDTGQQELTMNSNIK